jgi:peroxiredoxin family protein
MADGIGKLSVVVFDGRYDRVHYALVMASAAAATGRPATLFFTGGAVHALVPGGWRRLDGDPERRDAHLRERGIGTFEDLLHACAELGVRFIACEMGLRAEGLVAADLDPALGIEIAGVVTLLGDARADGALIFV